MCKGILMNCKFVNVDMINELYAVVKEEQEEKKKKLNTHNKQWIDNWVNKNYNKLYNKLNRYDYKINSSDFGKCDILHESIIRLYTRKDNFQSEEETIEYLNKFFKMK